MAVHLPSNVVTKEVAVARHHGAGETQPTKGILVVVGSFNDGFDKVGYHNETNNTFATSKHNVLKWKDFKTLILPVFTKDGALFIDGESGKIMADGYFIDLRHRHADQNGGSGHKNASAAGAKGCLAIKCSEDSCLIDGKGKGELKIFPGTKKPTKVPVRPAKYTIS